MMDVKTRSGIAGALGYLPQGLFILTARHEDRRAGMLASWVQQAGFEPPMVSVAVAKGRPIMPLLSESRCFGLCQLPSGEKTILRRFSGEVGTSEDPFLGLELLPSSIPGLPILAGTLAHLECELACHMDVEGDHDVFIGLVRSGGFNAGEPYVHLRRDGFRY